jgi:hypothetical protein
MAQTHTIRGTVKDKNNLPSIEKVAVFNRNTGLILWSGESDSGVFAEQLSSGANVDVVCLYSDRSTAPRIYGGVDPVTEGPAPTFSGLLLQFDALPITDAADAFTISGTQPTLSTDAPDGYSSSADTSAMADPGIVIAAHEDIYATEAGWTFDCWIKMNSWTAPGDLSAAGDPTWDHGWDCYGWNGMLSWWLYNGDDVGTLAGDIETGIWYHIAWVYLDGAITCYLNGIFRESGAADPLDLSIIGGQMVIGNYDGGGYPFNGKIAELNIVNYAKWTENFTPPTGPHG